MMKNEMKTNNKTVLLAIVAVFAMIAAGAVVVMSDGTDTDAAIGLNVVSEDRALVIADFATDQIVTINGASCTLDLTIFDDAAADYFVYLANKAQITITKDLAAGTTVTVASATDTAGVYAAGGNSFKLIAETDLGTGNVVVKTAANAAVDGKLTVSATSTIDKLPVIAGTVDISGTVKIGSTTVVAFGNYVAYAKEAAATTYFSAMPDSITMGTFVELLIKKGNTIIQAGTGVNAVTVVLGSYKDASFNSAAGITFTWADSVLKAKGTIATGEFYVASGSVTADAGNLIGTDGAGIITAATNDEEGTAILVHATKVASAAISATNNVVIGYYIVPDKTTVITKPVTIPAKSILVIPDKTTVTLGANIDDALAGDFTITVKGEIDVWGKLKGISGETAGHDPVNPTLTSTGAVTYRQGSEITNINTVGMTTVKEFPADTDFNTQTGHITTSRSYDNVVIGDAGLTIDEGVTLEITEMLALDGNAIKVDGKLVIAAGAQVGSTNAVPAIVAALGDSVNAIILGDKGSIVVDGVIAKDLPIVVGTSNTSKVLVGGVSGITYGAKVVSSNPYVSIMGDIEALKNVNQEPTVEISGGYIVGDVTIPKGITVTVASASNFTSGTITVNGMLDLDATITMDAGTVITVNGIVEGLITAKVTALGADKAKGAAPGATATISNVGDAAAPVDGSTHYITGFEIAVVKTSYTDADGNAMYYQHANISGALAVTPAFAAGSAAGAAMKLTVASGNFYVAEDAELAYATSAVLTTDGGKLIVEGELTGLNAALSENIIGAMYSLGEGAVETYYVVDFNTGLIAVALANNKLVTLHTLAGYEVELAGSIAIADKETIASTGVASLIIPEDISLVVENGATFDEAAIKKIDGRVIVEKDGDCTPASALYEVMSTDSDDTVTYCGFQTALNDAEAGDTISITSKTLKLTSLSVPAGITVVVESGAIVYVQKNITVAATAELDVSGTLNFGKKDADTPASQYAKGSKIAVNGTMDVAAGALVLFPYGEGDATATTDMQIASEGQLVYKAATGVDAAHIVLIGVIYQEGTKYVLTNMDTALEEGAVAITITDKYTTTDDFVLDGTTLTIAEGATASFGIIDATDSTIDVSAAGARLTATIAGTYGDEGITGVSVSEFNGTITNKVVSGSYVVSITPSDEAAQTAKTNIAVNTGEAVLAGGYTIAENYYLSVGVDGALIIDSDVDLVNAGTIYVYGDLGVAKTTGNLDIDGAGKVYFLGDVVVEGVIDTNGFELSGTMYIEEGAALTTTGNVAITGAMLIDEDAAASVTGNVVAGESAIGAGAMIGGKLTLVGEHFLMAFPGAVIDEATQKVLNKATEFYLNDVLYGTAYAANAGIAAIGAVLGATPIDHVVLVPGYNMADMTNPAKWVDADGKAITNTIGSTAAMFFIGVQKTADVLVSVATGMSIYVDGVKYASGTTIEDVSMGAHTVMVTVNPGYKYADGTSATVTFDGKVLSGILAFTITTDMADKTVVLSAIGDIVVDQPDIPEQEKEDNSMIMILLGILVVMVVILAIVTVIRMMRS